LNIQYSHVRLALKDEVLRHLAVIGFRDDLDISGSFQELADACPHNSMVVSQQYPDWTSFSGHKGNFSGALIVSDAILTGMGWSVGGKALSIYG
jgi:hypothetical protein